MKAIDLGDDLILEPATREDIDYVHAHLRDGDSVELDVSRKNGWEGDYTGALIGRSKGRIIGYIGCEIPSGETAESHARYIYCLTTRHVDEIKLRYVKRSREIFRAVVNTLPEWVDDILSVSMPDEYPMACKWLEKTLGFSRIEDIQVGEHKFRIFKHKRKEI